jgi:hypothetical protein
MASCRIYAGGSGPSNGGGGSSGADSKKLTPSGYSGRSTTARAVEPPSDERPHDHTNVYKSVVGSWSVTAATCVVGALGWLVKQDHPAYIPHTGPVRSIHGLRDRLGRCRSRLRSSGALADQRRRVRGDGRLSGQVHRCCCSRCCSSPMWAGDLDGSGSRGQEGAPIDSRLIAVAVAFAQCSPGIQLLRAHPLALIQVVHAAVEDLVPAGPQDRYLTARPR